MTKGSVSELKRFLASITVIGIALFIGGILAILAAKSVDVYNPDNLTIIQQEV